MSQTKLELNSNLGKERMFIFFKPFIIANVTHVSSYTSDYFWTGGKFAYDTRHDDWSHGVLFSP